MLKISRWSSKVIKEAMPKEDAEKLKEQLEEVGASVELK